jgi:hypothetical protein
MESSAELSNELTHEPDRRDDVRREDRGQSPDVHVGDRPQEADVCRVVHQSRAAQSRFSEQRLLTRSEIALESRQVAEVAGEVLVSLVPLVTGVSHRAVRHRRAIRARATPAQWPRRFPTWSR